MRRQLPLLLVLEVTQAAQVVRQPAHEVLPDVACLVRGCTAEVLEGARHDSVVRLKLVDGDGELAAVQKRVGAGVEVEDELVPDRLVCEVPEEVPAEFLVDVVDGDGHADRGPVFGVRRLAEAVFLSREVVLDPVLPVDVCALESENGGILVFDDIL